MRKFNLMIAWLGMQSTVSLAACFGDPLAESDLLHRMGFPQVESADIGTIPLRIELRTCTAVSGCSPWRPESDVRLIEPTTKILTDNRGEETARLAVLRFTAWHDQAWVSFRIASQNSLLFVPSVSGQDSTVIQNLWLLDDVVRLRVIHRKRCIQIQSSASRSRQTPENNLKRVEARLTGELNF